jgi:hypothetical protein
MRVFCFFGDRMNKITLFFWIAALYNACIILFSKGFSTDLGVIDPLFLPEGCIGILLWGAAYFALSRRYERTPSIALVFCFEKAFYGFHWVFWMLAHHQELAEITAEDPISGSFYAIYGIGDLLFMVFFGWVAWKWRHNISGDQS